VDAAPDAEVLAAGGVVCRRRDGELEVALIHRPKYDDWSLPKGKLDPGEDFEEAALREVEEETGLRCRLGDFLDEARYEDRRGRPKAVRYWTMTVAAEAAFEANEEVDELRWVSGDEAARELTYDFDRELVERALARPPAGA
jgi:8-oxo-dGTP diphosphatase